MNETSQTNSIWQKLHVITNVILIVLVVVVVVAYFAGTFSVRGDQTSASALTQDNILSHRYLAYNDTPLSTQLSAPRVGLTNQEIVKKLTPSVVQVFADEDTGTGMITTQDGFILTCAHVIKSSTKAQVKFSDGKVFGATVVGKNFTSDLAVLKIQNLEGEVLTPIDFGDSDTVQTGDDIFVFGFPFGLTGDVSFKSGTISRKYGKYFESSVEIHQGNSGGPLVNRLGEVVGINTVKMGDTLEGVAVGETIKMSSPINRVKEELPKLMAGEKNVASKINASDYQYYQDAIK